MDALGRRRLSGVVALGVGAGLILAAPRQTVAQDGNQAFLHLGHVTTGFSGAPDGRGLVITAAREANVAMMHANLAAGNPASLEAMKTHTRHVLHALTPGGGSNDPKPSGTADTSRPPAGPGLGFGLKRAADAVTMHIEMAAKAPQASDTLRKLGANAATAARALGTRAEAAAQLCGRILAAPTAAEAAPLVEQLRATALELDTGKDENGNGRIDLDAVEPGLNQLEAQVYSILEAEKLPRVLR